MDIKKAKLLLVLFFCIYFGNINKWIVLRYIKQ